MKVTRVEALKADSAQHEDTIFDHLGGMFVGISDKPGRVMHLSHLPSHISMVRN